MNTMGFQRRSQQLGCSLRHGTRRSGRAPERISRLLILGACAVLVATLPGAVSAQSSPTPTPAASPPGAQVMDQMMQAWEAAGSNHFTYLQHSVDVTKSAKTVTDATSIGDVAWTIPPTFSMTTRYTATRSVNGGKYIQTRSNNERQLNAQNRLAVRIGSRKWSCNPFYGYNSLPGTPVWDGTSPYGVPLKNLGQTTFHGSQVWHLQSVMVSPPPKGKKKPWQKTVRDYLASTATYVPVSIRIASSWKTRNGRGSSTTTFTFSDFGEQVHVALPKACKTP